MEQGAGLAVQLRVGQRPSQSCACFALFRPAQACAGGCSEAGSAGAPWSQYPPLTWLGSMILTYTPPCRPLPTQRGASQPIRRRHPSRRVAWSQGAGRGVAQRRRWVAHRPRDARRALASEAIQRKSRPGDVPAAAFSSAFARAGRRPPLLERRVERVHLQGGGGGIKGLHTKNCLLPPKIPTISNPRV